MIYLYLFGTCFHFIYVFMIIGKYINYYHIPYFIGGIFVFFMLYVSLQWLFIMTDYEKKLMKGLINR